MELSFKGWNVVDEWKGEMFEMNWRRKECISTRIELGQNPVRSSEPLVRSSEPGSVWFGAPRRWFARATLILWASLERTCGRSSEPAQTSGPVWSRFLGLL